MRQLANILLVEDNPDDVELIRHAFRKAEINVAFQVVTDGEQAIAFVFGDPPFADRTLHPLPSLILLDLKLPRRWGFEVLEAIKARLKIVPVVVLTSSNQDADIRRAYEAGANSYLVKPVRRDALIEMIRSIDRYWLGFNELVR